MVNSQVFSSLSLLPCNPALIIPFACRLPECMHEGGQHSSHNTTHTGLIRSENPSAVVFGKGDVLSRGVGGEHERERAGLKKSSANPGPGHIFQSGQLLHTHPSSHGGAYRRDFCRAEMRRE